MQESSKIESVVPFVVWNLWCIKVFWENSFTSWITRKIIFDFLGWLVWIPTHLVFISCLMILKKRFEKIRFENLSFLAYVKTIQTSAHCIALDCFKTREIGVGFSIQYFWSHGIASIQHLLVIGLSQSLKKYFSNFSWMFLNPKIFFQYEL